MIKAVVFDAYGTLFDVYSISALAEQLYPSHGAAISTLWRDKQIEYTRLISLSDPSDADDTGSRYFQSFWDITRSALSYTLARFKLDASAAKQDALMQQYAHLAPFPENLGVLRALKSIGVPTAILSNGSPDMLSAAVQNAGMQHLLDHVISVNEVKQFKTMPASYALVSKYFSSPVSEILFVSSNAWDALGATWFGFTTLWVNRMGLPFETIGPAPHYSGADLRRVLEVLTPGVE